MVRLHLASWYKDHLIQNVSLSDEVNFFVNGEVNKAVVIIRVKIIKK